MKDMIALLLKNLVTALIGRQLKKKAVLVYLKSVQGVRQGLLGLILFLLILQMMVVGLAGALTCAFFLWNEEVHVKLWVFFGLASSLFIIPAIVLIVVMSERFWFKASGAEKLLSEI